MSHHTVAIFIGSLRRGSFSRQIALAFRRLAPTSLALEVVEIDGLALYDEDLEVDAPAPWLALRDSVRRADAVLFVTPEYNRSIPGVLKNAIDIASGPYGHNAWAGKPGAIISVSPGSMGAFGANHHLRQTLVFLDVATLQQPEAYIGNVTQLLDDRGECTHASTREFLVHFGESFAHWIERNAQT